jgi:hypothetical protein
MICRLLANGLFRVVTVDLTYNGSDRQINVTSLGNDSGVVGCAFALSS